MHNAALSLVLLQTANPVREFAKRFRQGGDVDKPLIPWHTIVISTLVC